MKMSIKTRFSLVSSAKTFIKPALLWIAIGFNSAPVHAEFTMASAEEKAAARDFGIEQLMLQSKAARFEAEAQSQLPDPVLILGAQNFPTDTFEFEQEPMTQLKVGVRQMFPQGDSLSLKSSKFNLKADAQASAAQVRYLTITKNVRSLWLDIFYWERSTEILNEDEALFDQLLEVTRSLYGVGKVQQQDVLQAELERSRLQERIIKSLRQSESKRAQLARWTGSSALTAVFPEHLPVFSNPAQLQDSAEEFSNDDGQQKLFERLANHPVLQLSMQKVQMAEKDISLAEQKYQPAWGVELNYGYRGGNNMDGSDRSDFVSAMVNVSLPLYTATRQDKAVQSANYQKSAQEYDYQDKRLEMVGKVQSLLSQLERTEDQINLFDQHILTKARQQAEAALNAYQADAAVFGSVMRAYLREQKDRLDYQRLLVSRLQILSDLQFYFPIGIPEPSFDAVDGNKGVSKQ